MSRCLPLDPSSLRVETFGAGLVPIIVGAAETYPDCPTATGCTCVAACQSAVQPPCQDPITVAAA